MTTKTRWTFSIASSLLVACAPSHFAKQVAPGYLRCHPEQVSMERVDLNTYRASGCDRAMLYTCSANACGPSESSATSRQRWCEEHANYGRTAIQSPTTEASRPTAPKGVLSKAAIRAVIDNLYFDLRACFECADSGNDRLVLKFVITEQGQVSAIKPVTWGRSALLTECTMGVLRETTFPKPQGGGLIVQYPFLFETSPKAPDAFPYPR